MPVDLTDEEKKAWESAPEFSGMDPTIYRMDPVNDMNAALKRDMVNKKKQFGWVVDEHGRARIHDYRWRETARAARQAGGQGRVRGFMRYPVAGGGEVAFRASAVALCGPNASDNGQRWKVKLLGGREYILEIDPLPFRYALEKSGIRLIDLRPEPGDHMKRFANPLHIVSFSPASSSPGIHIQFSDGESCHAPLSMDELLSEIGD